MSLLPVFLELTHKKVVVIGGGRMAARRVIQIIASEPDLTVVSPFITETLQQLYEDNRLIWKKRMYQFEDLKEASLIILAAGDEKVHAAVHREAPNNAFINDVMAAESGSAIFPAHIKRGRLHIAVTTGGASPKLTKKITQQLNQSFPPDYEQYVEFLYQARYLLKQTNLSHAEKQRYLESWLHEKYQNPDVQLQTLQKLQKDLDTNENTY